MLRKLRKIRYDAKLFAPLYLCVGLLIVLAYHAAAAYTRDELFANMLMDPLERVERLFSPGPGPAVGPVRFVEIDAQTRKEWGDPPVTPRDKLALLIDHIARSGAAVIVLDILLETPDCCHPKADVSLRNTLERLLADKACKTSVIFSVRIGADGTRKPNLFDDLIDATRHGKGARFHRAVPEAAASVSDGRIRYWSAFRLGTAPDTGDKEVLWGVPLLAVALLDGKAELLERTAAAYVSLGTAGITPIELRGRTVDLRHAGATGEADIYQQRIRMQIIPPMPPGFEGNTLAITQEVADILAEAPDEGDPGLEGKIVVVGNSDPDLGDMLPTVLGTMPGMYVLGNAINTLCMGLQVRVLALWQRIAIESAAMLLALALLTRFNGFWVRVGINAAFLLLLLPATWWIFIRYGVFINILMPLFVIELFIKLHAAFHITAECAPDGK